MENEHAPYAAPLRVLWLTNLAAPYRVPVWEKLAEHHSIDVGLLESNKSLLNDTKSNRGHDWLHSEPRGFTYHEVPTWKLRRGESKYYILRNIRPLIRLRNYDAVLFGGWESPAYWIFLVVALLLKRRCVAFYESTQETMNHRRGPVAWIRSRFFRSMCAVVTPGPAATEALLSIGVSKARIHQGFNAVGVDAFRDAVSYVGDEIIEGHGYLYVGQLIERKRVSAVIDAFTLLTHPDDWLTIVGAGPLQKQLAHHARRTGVRIKFLPQISNAEMPALMAKHQTLVLASSEEVWGLVVNEALATGMHAVVTRNCGVAPSVQHMSGVFLVEPDLGDLVSKMSDSRGAWRGRVPQPAILRHTPAEFANVFEGALMVQPEHCRKP